ncbi:unnamed protein product [Allacma fusca]|uniref:Aminopeptidase n=1 Tax=Allacma fusca TaxID=39272 RepID=A0A8J2K5F4_9HEXA|nr:unnamed protein product [Allacma fusca]
MRKDLGLGGALTLAVIALSICINVSNAAPPLYDIKSAKYHGIQAEADPVKFRLSRDVIPINYELEIRVVLEPEAPFVQFTAPGTVKITVRVETTAAPQQSIRLHSETINITQSGIQVSFLNGSVASTVTSLEPDPEAQTVTILLGTALIPGDYDLTIPFVAPIPDGRSTSFGLYRSSYVNSAGVTRYYALTDFESVDARRMTPCFDEPDLKATWMISVLRQKSYKSLSNMDKERTEESVEPTWDKDIYKKTDPMSTYLVAIAVSDYDSEEASAGLFNKPVTIWGPPPMMAEPQNGGKYAADLSANLMAYFEDYLQKPYTFSKMDKFAVHDFSAGAMENWGLNTYRIVRLMYFEGESTIQEKWTMTNTIAHELAHQWFGNLVTMKWWDDIWLNEGFATHFANLASTGVYPEYGWTDYVVVDSVQYAMQADVRGTTHPLHYDGLLTPAETRLGFDTISYDKGASILRMVNGFMTEAYFKAAMKIYLDRHESGNTEQDELFTALHNILEGTDKLPPLRNTKEILDSWSLQSGFPLITVTRSGDTANVITVTQQQFVNDSRVYQPGDTKWFVPITYQTASTPYDPTTAAEWLVNDNNPLRLTITPATDEFLIINPEQIGYYRVSYDQVSLQLIRNILSSNPEALNQKTRSALIDDNLNLAFAGYVPIAQGLDVTTYLKEERNLVPWATFVTNMATPYRLLSRTGAFYYFRKYVRNLMSPALLAINIEPATGDIQKVADVILLRNRLFEWSCNLGLKECVDFSKAQVEAWRQNPAQRPSSLTVQPDLRPFVYCTAVANADNKQEVFNFIFERYRTADADTEQLSLLRALACSQEPNRLRELIDTALQATSTIRDAHRLAAIQAVAGNTLGTTIVIDSLRDKIDTFIERLGVTSISSVVTTLASYLSSGSEIGDINRFISTNENKLESIARLLNTSLATMDNNKNWIVNNYDNMRTWLMAHSS